MRRAPCLLFFVGLMTIPALVWAGAYEDFHTAVRARRRGNHTTAIKLYTRAINSGRLPRNFLAVAYSNRGAVYDDLKQYRRAIEDYSQSIQINPNYALAYRNRCIAYRNLKQNFRAIVDCNQAIRLDPDHADGYSYRAAVYYKLKQYRQAIGDSNQAIRINPNSDIAYRVLGNTYKALKQYRRAVTNYSQVIRINPHFTNAYLSRGFAYEYLRQYGRAIQDFTYAVQISPNNQRALNALAWSLATCPNARFRNGRKAVVLAKRAIGLKADAIRTDTLAAAYAEAGRFGDAIETQRLAIARLMKTLYTNKDLAEYLERLQYYRAHRPWRDK